MSDGFTAVEEYDGHELTYDEDEKTWYYTDDEGEKVEVADKDVQINYTKSFDNLPAGEYTVTETNTAIPGYDLDEASVLTGKATVVAGVESTSTDAPKVELSDVYVEQAGGLVIKKTITGGVTEEEAEGALTFTVTTEVDGTTYYVTSDGELTTEETVLKVTDGFEAVEEYDGHELTYDEEDETWYYTDDSGEKVEVADKDVQINYTKSFDNLPAGEYTVTETNTAIPGYDLDEASVLTGKATVVAGVESTSTDAPKVELSDEYVKAEGGLVIKKTITGGVTEEEAEGALTFTVTTEVDGSNLITVTSGWRVLLLTRTTEETVLKVTDGFTAVEEYDGHELTYDEENKTWYYTDDSGEKVEVEDKDVQINYTKSFDNLPAGEYTVTETNTAIPGYDLDEASVLTGKATVVAGVDSTSTDAPKVELSDEYVEQPGGLILKKTVTGGVTEEEAEGALTFTVTTDWCRWRPSWPAGISSRRG